MDPHRLPRWHSGKETTCQRKRHKRWGFDPWVGKIPWSRKWKLTHILAWKIPWTEEPDRLHSIGLQRVKQDWAHKHTNWAFDPWLRKIHECTVLSLANKSCQTSTNSFIWTLQVYLIKNGTSDFLSSPNRFHMFFLSPRRTNYPIQKLRSKSSAIISIGLLPLNLDVY